MNIILILFIIFAAILLFFSIAKDTKISKIKKMADNIYEEIYDVKKSYNVYKTSDFSRTVNKKDIYLVIKNENGRYYKNETILAVLLHELAHITCEDVENGGHSGNFYKIENKFIETAKRVGYLPNDYDMNDIVWDENYPCKN